jgi:phage shock protein C
MGDKNGDKNTLKDAEATGKRLYRSRTDRKVAGVLGGIAHYFGIDPSLVRIAYLIGTVLTMVFPLLALYILMAVIVPLEPKSRAAA